YLEQIIPVLNRAGFLQTSRGYQGGYRLSKSPEKYTVGEILRATEGSTAPVSCLEQDPNTCPRRGECATLPVWQGLQRVVDEYLDSITLQSILDDINEKAGNTYNI
ncbi:MAG: RrF2 family transcriptional regulator, partial [Acutalibacteraceae bacterium]